MGRWFRDRWPVTVGLIVVVAGTVVWIGWAYRLASAERSDALALLGIVLALLLGVPPLVAWLGQWRGPAARSVDALADLLAEAVSGQWRAVANERRLVIPEPIPLRWSLSDLAVTGPVTAALGTLGTPPAFPPLPDQARMTEADLHAGGGRTELHALYAGLASGRVVVVGAPGAGKSGAAILLLLDVLAHRDHLDNSQRVRIPVPVLLTAHGWNPITTSAQDWLAGRLAATYPMFAHRGGPAEAAALVAAHDKVALFLDGLDEMDEALRPAALQALADAPFRVVVLTRSQEMVQAASGGWLVGAVAVHLHDVAATEAADYLERARTGPPPSGWAQLLTCLRTHPDGVVARGLSTPLTLTLLRDTYQPGDDVRELLNPSRYPSPDAIEQRLIARVLPAAYTPRPGRPPPRYTEQQARQALTFIAQQMDTNRDLAWWHIPRWAPTIPRVLATGLAFELTAGLAFGLTAGLTAGLGGGEPQRIRLANWRVVFSRRRLGQVFAAGLTVGLTGGLIEGGTGEGSPLGPRGIWRNDQRAGLAGGLAFRLAFGLTVGLTVGLTFPETWATRLAWLQLRLAGRLPAVRLMTFLEDARERNVLHVVGPVYQFWHATLQDQLASQGTLDIPAEPAVSHVSQDPKRVSP